MTQNDAVNIKCFFCNYTTKRKFDLKRHHYAKHYDIKLNIYNNTQNGEKVHADGEKVHADGEKVHPKGEKVHADGEKVHPKFICKKCNKIYKSNRYLIYHEKKCNGIDDLTCPRCMNSFTTKQGKSNHLKRNNCKPRSIKYARKPNTQNIENINTNIENIENQNNIETQYNIENQNNNNIIINNYGNERMDYLNYEKMLEIFKKAYDIPTLLTKEIHFNIDFPENNNIIESNKTNCALIKMNEEFIYKNLNNLVLELINDKGILMQKFAIENKDNICLKMDTQRYEIILELLLKLILLKEPCELYKKQVNNIIDLIRNSNE